jgi:hypothetical protein
LGNGGEFSWAIAFISQYQPRAIYRKQLMKAEYDFSKGERGKFHHPDAEFTFPVSLEPDLMKI